MSDNFPKIYESYDYNWLERQVWKFQGIDTVYEGGSFTLNKHTYTYNGCYCIVNGEWEQRNDTLFLHHTSTSHRSTVPFDSTMKCYLLNSLYKISDNGNKIRVLDGRDDLIEIYHCKD